MDEKKLLNKLLDKYEKSKLSKGGTKNNRIIKLTPKDKELETYISFDSYKYVEENDVIIERLSNLGFINSKYDKDTFISLTLNIDNVDKIYEYLKRKKPSDELSNIKEILNKYKFDNFLNDFIEYIENYIIEKYDYPKKYFDDYKQLDQLLFIFNNLFKLTEDIKKRDFSAKYLKDSKLFESLENKIIKIIKDFDGNEYIDNDDVLLNYNIVKNSSYALIKNKLIFKLNNQKINLNDLKYEYSLSDEMIKNMEIEKNDINKVITVENLTSFYELKDNDSLIIYLAGFHNHTKQELLKKIYSVYPNAKYYHFSDIDVGGFKIFINLKDKTNINFIPYKMDKSILESNKSNLKKLTENDKYSLNKMINDKKYIIFKETIKYMLENNVKLEQEILD